MTLLVAPIILGAPVMAAAQEPVRPFDQRNTRLKAGDTVWATDARGREIKGRIMSLAADSLVPDA